MNNQINLRIFKYMEMPISAVTAAMILLASQVMVQAQGVISMRFDSGGLTGSSQNPNFMFPADIAGAPGVRTNNWNNIPAPYNANSPSTIGTNGIFDASGTTIPNMGCAAYFGGGGSDGWYDRVAPTVSTNDGKMFADVADVYGNNAIANFGYLQVTNIPYTNYNLYCYFRDDNGSGSTDTRGGFWLITNTPSGAERIYISNQTNDGSYTQISLPSTSGSGYRQSTTISIPSGGAAWTSIQGGNYVEFTGLTNGNLTIFFDGLGNGSGAKDDLGNYVNGGSAAVRFKVCGFQLQQVNLGSITNLYFSPSGEFVHAGNPSGTQTTLEGNTLGGQINTIPAASATYSSDNTNVAAVTTAGIILPGTNGIAHIIASYQGFYATNTVTNIGPTSLSISVAQTNLLSGNGQGDTTTATLYANFLDAANIPVNSFQYVSFSGTAGIVTVTSNGIVTAVAPGDFSITGTYDQMSVTATGFGTVAAYSAPGSVPSFAVKLTDNNTAHFMSFHDLSGATAVRFAYWNNMVMALGNTTNTYNTPYDYQGNVLTNTTIQILDGESGIPLFDDAFFTTGTATTNESKLFDTYWDQGMNNGTTVSSTMVISNVPYSAYDIYFYVYNDNTSNGTNRPGVFVIDGVDQWRLNNPNANTQPDNTGNGYVQAAPQPSGVPGSVVDVPYGNFVKFSGITDSNLTVQWAAVGQDYIGDAASVTRLRLVGFQVVSSFDGLTPTNIFLGTPVPSLLPGNPTVFTLSVLADYAIGVKNVPITDYPGITFASANTNIFSVDTNGNITAGLVPGTTNLVVTYDGLSLTQAVTVLSPISVTVGAMPNTVYIDSSLGQPQPAQADLFATFPGNTNINVSAFNSVSFVDQGSPVATLSTSGTITANEQGKAGLGASYIGNTYVTPNAFTVSSITNPPTLEHLYNFTNLNAVIDSIGGANGTIYGPLSTNQPITFDGKRIIFPGDGVYSDEPYVSLPQYLLANNMGDVTIELWGGVTARNTWERFLGFGNTPKGLTPYAYGGTASSNAVQLIAVAPPGADFNLYGLGDYVGTTSALTNNGEYYIVAEVAPNAGISAVYINGVLVTNVTLASGEYLSAVDDTVDWLGVSLSNDDPPLAGWMNKLAIWEGVMTASQVESNYIAGVNVYYPPGYSALPTNPPPIGFSYSGGNLNLSWPPNYLGYTLQAQTNTVTIGIGTNWVTVPNSTTVTNIAIPVYSGNGCVFYRLLNP